MSAELWVVFCCVFFFCVCFFYLRQPAKILWPNAERENRLRLCGSRRWMAAPRGSTGRSGLLMSPGDVNCRKPVLFPVCRILEELYLRVAGVFHARGCLKEEERSVGVCKTCCVFSSHWCSATTCSCCPLVILPWKLLKQFLKKSNISRLGFYFLCVTVCLENQTAIFWKETGQPQCSASFLPSMPSLAILCCCTASLPMLELSEMHHSLPYMLAVLSTISAPG